MSFKPIVLLIAVFSLIQEAHCGVSGAFSHTQRTKVIVDSVKAMIKKEFPLKKYVQSKLPYAYDALAPTISAITM